MRDHPNPSSLGLGLMAILSLGAERGNGGPWNLGSDTTLNFSLQEV